MFMLLENIQVLSPFGAIKYKFMKKKNNNLGHVSNLTNKILNTVH